MGFRTITECPSLGSSRTGRRAAAVTMAANFPPGRFTRRDGKSQSEATR